MFERVVWSLIDGSAPRPVESTTNLSEVEQY